MQDPPQHGGQELHLHDHQPHHHHGHEAHDADREAEGEDRPHTPSYLRPPVAGRAQSDSGSDPSLSQSRTVDFDLTSSVSPSRPKSPWGRFDPYCTNEVTRGGLRGITGITGISGVQSSVSSWCFRMLNSSASDSRYRLHKVIRPE